MASGARRKTRRQPWEKGAEALASGTPQVRVYTVCLRRCNHCTERHSPSISALLLEATLPITPYCLQLPNHESPIT